MNDALPNDHLHVAYPESFRVLNAEEASKVLLSNDADRWAIRDDNAHIIIAITWHESRAGLLQKLASTKDLAKRVQRKAHDVARKAEGSTVGELRQSQICGEEAWGFDCAYEVQGARQVSQTWVFKLPKGKASCCYTIYFYAREDSAEASRKVLDEIIASMSVDAE